MKPKCWTCGHYKDEHAEGSGACECVVIRHAMPDDQCFCTEFVLMTIERCEQWINRVRNNPLTNSPAQVDYVLRFLLEEAKRCT